MRQKDLDLKDALFTGSFNFAGNIEREDHHRHNGRETGDFDGHDPGHNYRPDFDLD